MGRQALQVLQKLLCSGLRIVYPVNHGVFKGNPPSGGFVVPAAGRQKRLHRVGFVHRHDGAANLVGGCMKGNRQGQLELMLRQLINLRHQAAGGEADVPHGDVHSLRAVHQLQKPQHIVKIVQRLSDAHKHNVRYRQAGINLGEEHLVQHFVGLQPPHQPP